LGLGISELYLAVWPDAGGCPSRNRLDVEYIPLSRGAKAVELDQGTIPEGELNASSGGLR